MKVMVTGATGFIGLHVVKELLNRGHYVIAVARDEEKAKTMPWFDRVEFVQCDLYKDFDGLFQADDLPDAVMHLAWAGLPNFKGYFHITENLPADLKFLTAVVRSGVKQLMVAGTCLEYGMQCGPLLEDGETHPSTPYGFAKDALRKALELLQKDEDFTLQWMRLFYMCGEGQNPNSLLAILERSIDEGMTTFNMSVGDQLRDYLSIEEIADAFTRVIEAPDCTGVVNCSSGKPVSVLDLVMDLCKEKNSDIEFNRGYYPYPDYEPMAFWGVPEKLTELKGRS
jgi:nucleoside-diphosphate-sugar epimerase